MQQKMQIPRGFLELTLLTITHVCGAKSDGIIISIICTTSSCSSCISSSCCSSGGVNVGLQLVINVLHWAVDSTTGCQTWLLAPVDAVGDDQNGIVVTRTQSKCVCHRITCRTLVVAVIAAAAAKQGMMFCYLLCATTGMLNFLLAMTFSVFLSVTVHPSHGLPVLVL